MHLLRGLQLMVGFSELIHGCIQFDFSSEVSFSDNAQVIGTYPGSSKDELFGICASRCTNDIRCNAIDICSENLKCKLIRGWTPLTTESTSEGVCQRFQMNCQDGYFFDRQNESCIQHDICDFESDPESTCFLPASPSSNFVWTRKSGSTPSSSTGPTAAYRGMYYKYIETTSGSAGDKAILQSSRAFQVKTYCLTMYYHMYGATINTLTIRTQRGNSAAIDRWTLSGNQGDVWHHLSGVNVPLDSQTKIIIEATKGSSFTGDIAIDYVELWPFACP
ncbi:MAM domain-containing glycosylphosphatidylinositol anchor protein 1-like [Magallana gigas]|uniref:MAM domain-containing glycosylphosphatidylinositol anchor protein 1-like n=1 Tax=Magallana gigas TaxID=29159 RepID=UPI00334278FA